MRRVLCFAAATAACGAPSGGAFESDGRVCPALGDLVITELAIRGVSYVEVYNTTARVLSLDDVALSVAGSGAPRRVETSGEVAAGDYRVVPVAALADAGGVVALACDDRMLDEVRYSAAESDVWALDGANPPDAAANDIVDNWCGQPGTAGGGNAPCGNRVCDGAAKPRRGELLVNEVMRDPVGADADGEWVELYVAADASVTLDGLVVEEVASSTRRFSLVAPPCFEVEPRTLVVLPLGGEEEPRLVRGSGLFNDDAVLTLRVDGALIDRADITCGRAGTSCAWVDDTWCETTNPTPGKENHCAP